MTPKKRPAAVHDPAVSTQETLSLALGNLGGRQKSWMLDQQPATTANNVRLVPPVKTRKRKCSQPQKPKVPVPPPPDPPDPPQQQQQQQEQDEEEEQGQEEEHQQQQQQQLIQSTGPHIPPASATRDSQPPSSSSTSPQLANVLTHHSPLPSSHAVLPSPPPSEAPVAATIAPTPAVDVPAPVDQNPRPALMYVEEQLRQAAAGQPEVVDLEAQAEGHDGTAAPIPQAPYAVASNATPHTPAAHMARPNAPQFPDQHMSHGSPSNFTQAPANPPQPQPLLSPSFGDLVVQQRAPFIRLVHRTAAVSVPAPWFTKADCYNVLETFNQGLRTPLADRDRHRITVLKEAIGRKDWDYLTIHQIYCAYDVARETLPNDIKNHSNFVNAQGLLVTVLDNNKHLTDPVKHFFAHFPYPLEELSTRWPVQYKRQEAMFRNFATWSIHYPNIQNSCLERRWPPLASELRGNLGITSPVLQKIVFTAILRSLVSKIDPETLHQCVDLEQRAIRIHEENYAEYTHQESRRPPHPPPNYDKDQSEAEARKWGHQLLQVYVVYEHRMLGSRPQPTYTQPYAQMPNQLQRPQSFPRAVPQQYQQQFPQAVAQQHQQPFHQAVPQQRQAFPQAFAQQQQQAFSQAFAQQQQQAFSQAYGQQQQAFPRALAQQQQQQQVHNGTFVDDRRQSLQFSEAAQQQAHIQMLTEQIRRQEARQDQEYDASLRRRARRGRPRLHDPEAVPGPHVQPAMPSPTVPTSDMLVPPLGKPLSVQAQPNPIRFALHEAYLRSPTLKPQSSGTIMHRSVCGFAKPPSRLLECGRRLETWTFPISQDDVRLVPADIAWLNEEPALRTVTEDSRTWRLRCVKWPSTTLPDEHTWAVTPTSWIPYTYITFNGVDLHPRLKLQYGKDLPLELTPLIKEGDNKLEIAVMREDENDVTSTKYLLAIEVLCFRTREQIARSCLDENHIPSATIMDKIKQKLSANGGDDDVTIVEQTLTVPLYDPISGSQLPDIPVRSKACAHNQCFDLDIFLQSRSKQNDVTETDTWRCPICRVDARPQHLIVDGLIEKVTRELKSRGLGSTRAITISDDGTWAPKAETRSANGVRESRDNSEERPMGEKRNSNRNTGSNTPNLVREVIDLSD